MAGTPDGKSAPVASRRQASVLQPLDDFRSKYPDEATCISRLQAAGEAAAALHATTESAAHFGQALDAARQIGDAAAIARLEAKGPTMEG